MSLVGCPVSSCILWASFRSWSVNDALRTIQEGTDRTKKEALSKVLERIDCYFDYRENAYIRHRLARVVFTPLAIRSQWDDTKEQTEKNRQRQEQLLAAGGEKDGVKIGTTMHYDHVAGGNAMITEEGREYIRSLSGLPS